MEFKDAVGVDVSKLTLDVKIYLSGCYRKFENKPSGFRKMIKWIIKNTGPELARVAICFEHTGLYSLTLAVFLTEQQIAYTMVPGQQIKKSMGMVRGKNDKADAGTIAEYAFLRKHKLKVTELPSKNILSLKSLIALRHRMVTQRAGYKASLKEMKHFLKAKDNKLLFECQKKMIRDLTKRIDQLEKQMRSLIKGDLQLNKYFQLITTVKGVGLVTAASFLVITNCFTAFETSNQFACYAGIAPFKKQSGTSLNTKSKVSNMANKKMKALLNMAASSAIQHDPELRAYYQSRLNKGKSKMSTLNIVRNKIVKRVFAVAKRQTPYVVLGNHVA